MRRQIEPSVAPLSLPLTAAWRSPASVNPPPHLWNISEGAPPATGRCGEFHTES
jgi:hypothetical protein